MADRDIVRECEERCREIQNSPYLRQAPPEELQNLRTLLTKVDHLTREDVPSLIAEVKRLRSQNKRLETSVGALQTVSQSE